MTLTQCFFALLHPDSIKNGLMAPLRDWRLFCHWALCSASWLMGSPGGLSEVSLKNKVWESERGMCLQMCIGKWMWCTLQGFLKCWNFNRNNLDSHIEGIPGLQTSLSLKRPCEREPACLPAYLIASSSARAPQSVSSSQIKDKVCVHKQPYLWHVVVANYSELLRETYLGTRAGGRDLQTQFKRIFWFSHRSQWLCLTCWMCIVFCGAVR